MMSLQRCRAVMSSTVVASTLIISTLREEHRTAVGMVSKQKGFHTEVNRWGHLSAAPTLRAGRGRSRVVSGRLKCSELYSYYCCIVAGLRGVPLVLLCDQDVRGDGLKLHMIQTAGGEHE